MEMEKFLRPTGLLDFEHRTIQDIVDERSWADLVIFDRIGAVYTFVRDEIKFGYNRGDKISASEVLDDGYGQCNTKAILLMALLRAVKVPTRFHGFTIDKSLQRGVVPELIYPITPDNIVHSWVEVYFDGKWLNLEGFILDRAYLNKLAASFPQATNFCGYGAGTKDLQNPNIDWRGGDTYIQSTAINNDFGVYDSPDKFFVEHQQNFSWWKRFLFVHIIRHWMNWRVQAIREGNKPR